MSDPAFETDDDAPRNRAEAALMAASAQDVGLLLAFEQAGMPFPPAALDAKLALFGHLRRLSRKAREEDETDARIIGLEAIVNWAIAIISDEREAIAESIEDLRRDCAGNRGPNFDEAIRASREEIEIRDQFLETAHEVLRSKQG